MQLRVEDDVAHEKFLENRGDPRLRMIHTLNRTAVLNQDHLSVLFLQFGNLPELNNRASGLKLEPCCAPP